MKLIKCDNGHWYDGEKYAFCPHCRAKENNQDIDKWYEKDEAVRKTQLVNDAASGNGNDRRTELVNDAASGDGNIRRTELVNDAASGGNVRRTEMVTDNGQMQGAGQQTAYKGQGSQQSANAEYLKNEHHMMRCLHCFEEYDTEHFDRCPYCGYVQGTAPKVSYHLHPGTMIGGRYIIGTVEGYGGFGITYRAWDTNIKSVVAIKEYYPAGIVNRVPGEAKVILYTGKGNDEYNKGMTRFLEEAQNTARFSEHPNFVHVYDFFQENGTAYMIMELLRGETLENYTKRCGGIIPCEDAVRIYSFIADAVGELHKNNIIHRDLSPDNFFICESGEVKLMDLGAARFASNGEEERTVILKIGLAPPEQYFKNGRQGPWTDVYALTASLYETVTGAEPEESTDRQVNDNLLLPSQINPDIPQYLDNVITRGMALNPDYRFQNMDEFKKAICNEEQVLALHEEIKRRKTRRALIIGIVSLVIIAGVIFGVSRFRSQQKEAYLSECTIEVWVPYDDSTEGNKDEEIKVYEDMSSEFMEEYPSVTIKLEPVPESGYMDEIEDALSDGDKDPTLFMSTGLSDELMDSCAPIDKALDNVDLDDFVYIKDYEDDLRSSKQIPLGFEVLAAYGNTIMANEGEKPAAENDIQGFLAGSSVLCIDSTARYYDVQDALAGRYSIMTLPTKEQYAKFDTLWSVNDKAGKDEKNAAFRLLSFWLGENAQDVYCIQNRKALPLNSQKLSELTEINSEESDAISRFSDTKILSSKKFRKKKDELYADEALRAELYETLQDNAKEQMNE